MKCFYFLSPSLVSTKQIIEALQEAGVDDWFIHVLSQDEAGLKREKIHASNYLERLDLLRFGMLGAGVGFLLGSAAAGALMEWPIFGPELPGVAYFAVVLVLTLFGAWEGGLIGVASENKKVALFHDELAQGQFLLLVYTPESAQEKALAIVKKIDAKVRLVAVDSYFYNPLAELKRLPDTV